MFLYFANARMYSPIVKCVALQDIMSHQQKKARKIANRLTQATYHPTLSM